jgi:hypothetical protein
MLIGIMGLKIDIKSRVKIIVIHLCITLFFCSTTVFAQEYVDIFNIQSSYSSRTFEEVDSDLDFYDFNLSLLAPILLSNNDAVLLGFDYNRLIAVRGLSDYFDVYSTGFRLGYNKVFPKNLSISFFAIPRISGEPNDLENVNQELGFAVLARKSISQDSNYKLGF